MPSQHGWCDAVIYSLCTESEHFAVHSPWHMLFCAHQKWSLCKSEQTLFRDGGDAIKNSKTWSFHSLGVVAKRILNSSWEFKKAFRSRCLLILFCGVIYSIIQGSLSLSLSLEWNAFTHMKCLHLHITRFVLLTLLWDFIRLIFFGALFIYRASWKEPHKGRRLNNKRRSFRGRAFNFKSAYARIKAIQSFQNP